MAYRLDRQDYSSRAIAKILNVSPATAWRLVGRGERMPPHLRDGVDLEVPMPAPAKKKRDWAKIRRLAGISTLPPTGGKAGPDAQRREDEGEQTSKIAPSALRAPPHLNPLPAGERTSEGDAETEAPPLQTLQPGEAVKRPLTRAHRQWRTPLLQLMKAHGFD